MGVFQFWPHVRSYRHLLGSESIPRQMLHRMYQGGRYKLSRNQKVLGSESIPRQMLHRMYQGGRYKLSRNQKVLGSESIPRQMLHRVLCQRLL